MNDLPLSEETSLAFQERQGKERQRLYRWLNDGRESLRETVADLVEDTVAYLPGKTIEDLQQEALIKAMRRCLNNRNAVAEELGVTSRTVYLWLKRLEQRTGTRFSSHREARHIDAAHHPNQTQAYGARPQYD